MKLPRAIKRHLSHDEFFARMRGREFTAGDTKQLMGSAYAPFGMLAAGQIVKTGATHGHAIYRETEGHRRARERRQERAQAFLASLDRTKAQRPSSGAENGGCA